MRIIVNSDVLYSRRAAPHQLPAHLDKLFREAGAAAAILVIPRTVLLEHEHQRKQVRDAETAELQAAAERLRGYGVSIAPLDLDTMLALPAFVELVRATGATVEIENPSYQDYEGAERRACMHLPPYPPDTKSDEMRDLVIWEVALRIARRDGKAILFSRDSVHSGSSGAAEAATAHLHRAATVDDVMELLGKESPAGASARRLLEPVWSALRDAGLPLSVDLIVTRILRPSFALDGAGHLTGTFSFEAPSEGGSVSAAVSIHQRAPEAISLELVNVTVKGEQWHNGSLSLVVPGTLPLEGPPDADSLEQLRRVIGDAE